MKHNIRINGEVKEIDCELGSGILDKNGREIFEGDRVQICNGLGLKHQVFFISTNLSLDGKSLKRYNSSELEIVD